MKSIYILEFADSGNYCAYATYEKAKQVLWETYCEEVDKETREKFLDEDLKTLEDGYIIDYGYVDEVTFVNE
jgi:inorganic pyrophosphatase